MDGSLMRARKEQLRLGIPQRLLFRGQITLKLFELSWMRTV